MNSNYTGTAFIVDRSTSLGNPFVMFHETERESVIKKFEEVFDKLYEDKDFAAYFNTILEEARKGDITLLCWCFPKDCHARIIKEKLEEQL